MKTSANLEICQDMKNLKRLFKNFLSNNVDEPPSPSVLFYQFNSLEELPIISIGVPMRTKTTDPFVLSDALSGLSNVPIPKAVTELKDAEVRHKTVCEIGEMKDTVKRFLKKC